MNNIEELTKINSIIDSIFSPYYHVDYITPVKDGMTNDCFRLGINKQDYILRLNGLGTEELIDRNQELEVYNALKSNKINFCDEIIALDIKKGYKLSKFIANTRNCNSKNNDEVERCIKKLREFHNCEIKIESKFDIVEQIIKYEELRKAYKDKSFYADYEITKLNCLELIKYINSKGMVLAHIDAVCDNFLIQNDTNEIYLIDWEYAAMCDPHIDLAMFALYAMYTRQELDFIIDIYFDNNCTFENKRKIYAYMALGGLLWSNWCEYKMCLGENFDSRYPKFQYEAAKYYTELVDSSIWSSNV